MIDEDYHSIMDDIPLFSMYTTENVLVRGMLIPDDFLTEEICATDDFKEYETVFVGVDVPMNQPQPVVSTQGTHRSTPRAHRTPTISTASPQGKKRKQIDNISKIQEKLDEEEIKKMVEGDEDEESYASVFVDSMINDDVDDSGTKIEHVSHKEHSENIIDDDEEFENEKKDNKIEKENNIDDVEKTDEVVKEKDIDVATGSMEFRKEKMQTPIPSPTRSPRKVSSFDKTASEELIATTKVLPGSIAGMFRHYGQIRSHIKNKFIIHDFFMGKIREVLDHCNKVVPKLTFAKTNEIINKDMTRLVNLAVNKDRKHMHHTTLNLYPTSSSTARKSTTDLQQQLYLNMKSKPQDQAVDPELWEILKAKFEKQ
ncbi:hypothetical protein Tco_0168021 [Tanacetum coccineum]